MSVTFTICAFLILCVAKLIRRYYKFPTPAFMTKIIDNPIRRGLIQRPDVVAGRMRLSPGMKAVEIGPGKGSYSFAFAKRILPYGTLEFGNWFVYQLNFVKK